MGVCVSQTDAMVSQWHSMVTVCLSRTIESVLLQPVRGTAVTAVISITLSTNLVLVPKQDVCPPSNSNAGRPSACKGTLL